MEKKTFFPALMLFPFILISPICGYNLKDTNFTVVTGTGDDWGYPHGEFLAEKNVYFPVASEVTALDQYLKTTIWNNLMEGHRKRGFPHCGFSIPGENRSPHLKRLKMEESCGCPPRSISPGAFMC